MSQKVPLELSEGLEKKHSPISKDWSYNGAKIELRDRKQEGKEQR